MIIHNRGLGSKDSDKLRTLKIAENGKKINISQQEMVKIIQMILDKSDELKMKYQKR